MDVLHGRSSSETLHGYQLEYCEALFPWLAELKGEDVDDLIRQALEKESPVSEVPSDDDPARP
ncbi:MAG: hypothetical protein HY675_28675 [Chloroflexi bacterium]|nr:hypothetical protein [Chloroflexota bacterium]